MKTEAEIEGRLREIDELIVKLNADIYAARAVKGELEGILAGEKNEKNEKDEKDN